LHVLPEVTLQILHFANATATFVVFSFLSHYYLRSAHEAEAELKLANLRLTELAHTDPLTHLLNRRTMMEQLERQAAHYRDSGDPFRSCCATSITSRISTTAMDMSAAIMFWLQSRN
jgi:predicted signal transduction protein with EAL and GGDEF domain